MQPSRRMHSFRSWKVYISSRDSDALSSDILLGENRWTHAVDLVAA